MGQIVVGTRSRADLMRIQGGRFYHASYYPAEGQKASASSSIIFNTRCSCYGEKGV